MTTKHGHTGDAVVATNVSSMGHMTPPQLIDRIGAELAWIAVGALLGAAAGVIVFTAESFRHQREVWPR